MLPLFYHGIVLGMKEWLISHWGWNWLSDVPETVVIIVGIVLGVLVIGLVYKGLQWMRR